MNLNHINLPVADVAATRDFLAKYFGLVTVFELPKERLAILRDEGGMVVNLSHFDKKTEVDYHKDFHIGFFVETVEEVDAMHARMTADGIVADPPKKLPGRYAFYVHESGRFVTEVARLDPFDRQP